MTDVGATLEAIRRHLGVAGVITAADRIEALLVDERRLYRGRAALVVQPADTAEVAAVVRLCAAAGIGIVPQGGNTGYCGGATPDASGTQILLSLTRMRRIRALDPVGFTLVAEAGAVLAEVQQAAAAQDLLFPLSMGSEGSCRIGGNVATNAGGLAVLRYGMMRDLVLGLEVVLPDGTVLDLLRCLRKDNTGYDLKQLFIGAEGTLGIVTAVALKLFPRPRARCTALLAVRDLDAVSTLLASARRDSGDTVTAFEYLSGSALALLGEQVPDVRAPFADAHAHLVLIELSSSAPGAALDTVVEQLCTTHGELVADAVVARSDAQTHALWRLRELIPEAEKRAGGSIKHDVSVPIADLATLCVRAEAAVRALLPQARLSVYGHVGDGNVHFNVLAPPLWAGGDFRARWSEPVGAAVHACAAALGGSFSAEHGVGQLKRAELLRHEPAAAIALMRALKRSIDPQGIMNPGKVVDP
ncbi:MAG: FAD-binding oxidoreductase [Gammaproteobacteria bacterium]|nr:FAD-binding oxidoreductase [Gammaproteobacteria bacterium]